MFIGQLCKAVEAVDNVFGPQAAMFETPDL